MSSLPKHTTGSDLEDTLCWSEVSNLPGGINVEDVISSLRLPRGKAATVDKVIWPCPHRTTALLGISGLDSEGKLYFSVGFKHDYTYNYCK